jgi:uncharacterized protein
MSKQIYVNLPVADIANSAAFYEALGFTKNPDFSDEHGSSMMWSQDIVFMLLDRDFYKQFPRGSEIIDAKKTSGVLLALSLDSKEAVQQFANTAKEHGGDYYTVDMGTPADMMFGYEVEDPDGHILEAFWMNPDFKPHNNA